MDGWMGVVGLREITHGSGKRCNFLCIMGRLCGPSCVQEELVVINIMGGLSIVCIYSWMGAYAGLAWLAIAFGRISVKACI